MAQHAVNDVTQLEIERMLDEGCPNSGPFFWEKVLPEPAGPAKPQNINPPDLSSPQKDA
jgi:hypothetical protein